MQQVIIINRLIHGNFIIAWLVFNNPEIILYIVRMHRKRLYSIRNVIFSLLVDTEACGLKIY
ncbi:hypothetical protein SAMN05216325_10936 [Nitrosomonas marina]|uniref:Uncharacterized protein n=1 Tax=Nitrosomonas marina TaxID=917 RepID=A0A1H8EDM0_9PROT|nr:hypothetical protein SAMN05216325_10936 [Nitrosomonas marina]